LEVIRVLQCHLHFYEIFRNPSIPSRRLWDEWIGKWYKREFWCFWFILDGMLDDGQCDNFSSLLFPIRQRFFLSIVVGMSATVGNILSIKSIRVIQRWYKSWCCVDGIWNIFSLLFLISLHSPMAARVPYFNAIVLPTCKIPGVTPPAAERRLIYVTMTSWRVQHHP
jgi:hypothetical protein